MRTYFVQRVIPEIATQLAYILTGNLLQALFPAN